MLDRFDDLGFHCTTQNTGWAPKANAAIGNLDRQWVRCNPNEFLQSFVLTLASNYEEDMVRYKYRCCSLNIWKAIRGTYTLKVHSILSPLNPLQSQEWSITNFFFHYQNNIKESSDEDKNIYPLEYYHLIQHQIHRIINYRKCLADHQVIALEILGMKRFFSDTLYDLVFYLNGFHYWSKNCLKITREWFDSQHNVRTILGKKKTWRIDGWHRGEEG